MRSRDINEEEHTVINCFPSHFLFNDPMDSILYASVTKGGKLFMDAVVYAEVIPQKFPQNSTKFRLYDNGEGTESVVVCRARRSYSCSGHKHAGNDDTPITYIQRDHCTQDEVLYGRRKQKKTNYSCMYTVRRCCLLMLCV